MATDAGPMSNHDHLAAFDEEVASQRLEVEPEGLTEFDLEAAVDRAELEAELEEIDAKHEAEIAAIEADDGPTLADRIRAILAARRSGRGAEFATTPVEFCGAGGCPTVGDPDDLVIRRGLIFRAGRYDDVNYSMSPADLARAKQLFRPVPIRLEHRATLLDGHLGTLQSVNLSADGSELHGEAALPRWLANLIPADMPLKVSASWDRATKLLRELSLVLVPRVQGAALAAFAAVAGDDTVTRELILYRAGDEFAPVFRPDAGEVVATSLTKAELARAVEKARLPMAVAGGAGATLTGLRLGDGGRTLLGTLALPPALDDALARLKLKVGVAFDREHRLLSEVRLSEWKRPVDHIDSPITFSEAERTAMSQETDAQYAERVCRTHLSPRARTSLESTPAAFGGGPAAAPAAAAPPEIQTQVIRVPAPPTAEEDAAFVARLAPLGPVAAATIRSAIAALESQARQARHGAAFNWPATVRSAVERAERLRAMLAAVESGSAYRAPSPSAILEAQGRAIVGLALGGRTTPADLARAVRSRLEFARKWSSEAEATLDGLVRAWAHHAGDVEALRERYVPAAREAEALRAELAAVERTAEGLAPAMGAAVARAVEGAGGSDQVASDLADARLIDATPATPGDDEEELAAVDGQLKALGPATGRAAQALRARRGELAEAVESRRGEARTSARAEAAATVEGALSGRFPAWRELADAVASHPDAFAEGLGPALEAAPLCAFEAAGFAGCAPVIL